MTPAAKQRTEILQLLGLPFQIFATKGNTIKIIICCKFFFFFIGQLHESYNSYVLACVQTELNCWLSQSVKQRQNPSSVSLPVYQDLNMCLASPQTSFGVRTSRIHFSGRNKCVTNEPQRTSAGRLICAMIGLFKKLLLICNQVAGKFYMHFWQFVESVSGPGQGSWHWFADVTNWG